MACYDAWDTKNSNPIPSSFPAGMYILALPGLGGGSSNSNKNDHMGIAKDDLANSQAIGKAIQANLAKCFHGLPILGSFPEEERAPRKALLILLGANRQSEEAVRALCECSKIPDAMVIVRTMYERLFNMKYILHDQRNRRAVASRFLESKILGEKRRLDLSKRTDGPTHLRVRVTGDESQIESDYHRFCQTYGITGKNVPEYWHSSSLADISKTVGEEVRFRIFGGTFSEFVHLEGLAKQGVDSDSPIQLVAGTAWIGFENVPCGVARDILLDSWETYAFPYQRDDMQIIRVLKDQSVSISKQDLQLLKDGERPKPSPRSSPN